MNDKVLAGRLGLRLQRFALLLGKQALLHQGPTHSREIASHTCCHKVSLKLPLEYTHSADDA
jgi:hypothetical protein